MKYFKLLIVAFFILLQLTCNKKTTKKVDLNSTTTEIINNKNITVDTIVKTLGNLELQKRKINIGKVKRGRDVIYTFIMKNIGSEDVKLVSQQTSCNCTAIDISKIVIAPADTVSITMKVTTKDKGLGKHNVYTVLTTNGQHKYYNLEIIFILIE
ncbi:DUF1573 domain-containing protein [Capnocytophaga sp. oral taxon 878]|uniref:Ig-like domain-containing protein n=1 Tax=Capnocytophaga sp. oral taxon 878 TaxID=1316596 RepID=UPI000D032164|nr:DUF1573 domain-containing protein [Capnocytophaga sp. oral taxon 878]AVM50612.1 hypothetical protein C4H12_09080 [Capnocytophaga sp. oral taxon 878]